MDNFNTQANQNPNNFIKNTKNDFAYIITIFGNDNYIIGAQCCSKALQSNKIILSLKLGVFVVSISSDDDDDDDDESFICEFNNNKYNNIKHIK